MSTPWISSEFVLFPEEMPPVTKLKVAALAPHLTCPLCKGYFIDATTITECLHSFCKTCIINYLKTNQFCPICEVQVHKTKSLLSLRPDQSLQAIVYKLVPGLCQSEMRRRKLFYQLHPEIDTSNFDPEVKGEMKGHRFFYAPEDPISLVMEFQPPLGSDGKPGLHIPPRYLNCPAGVTINHLKKLTRMKFNLDDNYQVDIMYEEECLPQDYTLIDVAYIFKWTREAPLSFTYKIYQQVKKVRRVPRRPILNTPTATDIDQMDPAKSDIINNNVSKDANVKVASVLPTLTKVDIGESPILCEVSKVISEMTDKVVKSEKEEMIRASGAVSGDKEITAACDVPLSETDSATKLASKDTESQASDNKAKHDLVNGSAKEEKVPVKSNRDPFLGSPLKGIGSNSLLEKATKMSQTTPRSKQGAVSGHSLKRPVSSPFTPPNSKVPKLDTAETQMDKLNHILPAVGLTPKIPKKAQDSKKSAKGEEPQFEALDLSNHKIRPVAAIGPPKCDKPPLCIINTPLSITGSKPLTGGGSLKSPTKRGKGQATQTILSIAESLANKQLSNMKNKSSEGAALKQSPYDLLTLCQTAEKFRNLELLTNPSSPLDGQTFPRGSSPPSPSMYGTTLANHPRLPSDTVLLPEKSRMNILKVPDMSKSCGISSNHPHLQANPQTSNHNGSQTLSILKSFITNRGMSTMLKIPNVKPTPPKPPRPTKKSLVARGGGYKSPIESRMHELIKNQQLIKKQQPSNSSNPVPKFFQKSSPSKPFQVNIFRSPNPNVRQIPNPSLLRCQSQDRLPCPHPDKKLPQAS